MSTTSRVTWTGVSGPGPARFLLRAIGPETGHPGHPTVFGVSLLAEQEPLGYPGLSGGLSRDGESRGGKFKLHRESYASRSNWILSS